MIYKYVWQTCQQSLKIISIEQYFVRGNYTFSESCSSRNIHTPPPHPRTPPPPPPPHHGGQKFQGEGGPKGGNFRGVGGLPLLTEVFFNPLPITRYPSPATRHPLPATRHPPPAEKSCRFFHRFSTGFDVSSGPCAFCRDFMRSGGD